MTVKELIELLSKENPDKLVLVTGYEGGYDPLKEVRQIKVKLGSSENWWDGEYEDYPQEACDIAAILLPR
jgi:hypothetical protein